MDNLNFNIYNVIILAGIIHGAIFSFILFINKKLISKANYFLGLTVLSLALSNLQYFFIDTGIIPKHKYIDNSVLFIPFEFLMLPFFFLFVKNYLDRKITKNNKIYLFSPFLLCFIYLLFRNFLNDELSIIKFLNLIVEYISIIFSVFIIGLIFKILIVFERENTKYDIDKVNIKTKWLKKVLILGLILCIIWLVSLNLFKNLFSSGYYKYYPLWIGMSVLIYWIGYTAIFQRHIYTERKKIRNKLTSLSFKENLNRDHNENSSTFIRINDLIINNKIYLDSTLSLKTLSKKLNLSEGYISQQINTNSGINFNDYINKLRIENAKQILIDQDFDNYTIESIGLESGFNSKSSFYAAFKKFTNKTPNQFKKDVRNL